MNADIRKILCPTDFSKSAQFSFQYAVSLASRYHASIELYHVVEPSAYDTYRIEESEKTYKETILERISEQLKSTETDVHITVTMETGVPYVKITQRADTSGADLIIIGTHGRTGIRHLLIGSVAEKVVRTAICPVLTVRHPEFSLKH
ncbi:universal stress protein [bacterium]|nr:universal stress protein [bacterium]